MAISKATRDQLLVDARHRCTVCSEKCFELHHIVERAEGGGDDPENLIVLCPNCHQHRYHRSKEFTRDQLHLYKTKLKEQNEVERRLLLNLEELRSQIGTTPSAEIEANLRKELAEAASQVGSKPYSTVASEIGNTAQWLAERELLKGGARRAIEIEWELERERAKDRYPTIHIVAVDDDGWSKAPDFAAAYTLVLRLDRSAYSEWEQIFENEYAHAWYTMKRSTRVRTDRIVMIVADSDNLQGHVDFAKQLVERTNGVVERHLWTDLERQIDNGKEAALREFDTIKSLKQATRNLRI